MKWPWKKDNPEPAAEPPPAPSPPESAPRPPPPPPPPPAVPSKGKTILIVDDNEVVLTALSMRLAAEGYAVVTAEDGGTAVATARQQRPDLILLDISFPPDVAHGGGIAWDGFLIMDWLRRLEEAKDIPIIIITGGEAEEVRDRALAAGAVSFLQKPIDNEELLSAIGQALGTT